MGLGAANTAANEAIEEAERQQTNMCVHNLPGCVLLCRHCCIAQAVKFPGSGGAVVGLCRDKSEAGKGKGEGR